MKGFKPFIYLFTSLLIIASIMQGCGAQKAPDGSTNKSDTTYGKPISYLNNVYDPDAMKEKVLNLIESYGCLESCPNCLKEPCNPPDLRCENICSKYRSIIRQEDSTDRPSGEEGIADAMLLVDLLMTNEANEVKHQIAFYKILSKETTQKFQLMEADLNNLMDNLDLLYKKRIAALSSFKNSFDRKTVK